MDGTEDNILNDSDDENDNTGAEVDNDEQIADVYDDVINRENFLELFGNSEDEEDFEGF